MKTTRRQSLQWLGAAATFAGLPISQAEEKSAVIAKAIPSSGEKLPAIGFGTWQVLDIGPDAATRAPMKEVIREFAALGGTMIDSSPMYGQSETVAGDLISELGLRKSLFIATKVWIRGQAAGVKQMEESMAKLKCPVIDLMQVHNLLDVGPHLETLRAWKKEGRIRYLGITHYHAGSHAEVEKVLAAETVDFLQINYSVGERESERKLLPLAQERGVAVIANRPFAGGNLFARLSQKPLPDFAKEIACESWAQLLLKFIISHPAVTCAIPATSKIKHLRDNMTAMRGPLPDEALRQKIAEAAAV